MVPMLAATANTDGPAVVANNPVANASSPAATGNAAT